MKSKTSATLMLILTFLLGIVAGSVGYYLLAAHMMIPGPRSANRSSPHDIAAELATGLHLKAEQTEKLKDIIHQSRERYRALSVQFRPQYEALRSETRQQIRQILTEEQKARFEQIVKEIDQHRKNREHRPDR